MANTRRKKNHAPPWTTDRVSYNARKLSREWAFHRIHPKSRHSRRDENSCALSFSVCLISGNALTTADATHHPPQRAYETESANKWLQLGVRKLKSFLFWKCFDGLRTRLLEYRDDLKDFFLWSQYIYWHRSRLSKFSIASDSGKT